MKCPIYHIKVPGKLMIAGEYAVLESGQPAIVVAVDRFINVTIKASHENILSLPQLGHDKVTWTGQGLYKQYSISDGRLQFVQQAIAFVESYLEGKSIESKPFHLTVLSELNDSSGRKYGLGSSAAIVVGVVTAMLKFNTEIQIQSSSDLIFKLSVLAHFSTQGSGSGADIAAAVYGGWIQYNGLDRDWLIDQLNQQISVLHLVDVNWPGLRVQKISPPRELQLCVGWTTSEASTVKMIDKVHEIKKNDLLKYQYFIKESNTSVTKLVESFRNNDYDEAIIGLYQNRQALLQLSHYTNASIETKALTELATIAEKYGGGKSSGAGGGDCGIAFVKGEDKVKKLKNDWQTANIVPLDISISLNGITVKREYK
ncbi:phosphomevalonate kinase [Aquibacillus kalidii]|uniref:phosphomevalonate kinase n=1 Tax=Aquibacillus kalidii TaxID=2762597 RepID=UPI0016465BFB|nr:phosphomevalonate kinase [Aquibacillus kalidii]